MIRCNHATMVEPYSTRLASAMRNAGLDITALSKVMKVSYQAVKKAVDGGKFGTENNIRAAAALGVSSEWLATGKGSRAPSPAAQHGQPMPPGERFDALSADEQRFLLNLREIQVDEEQYQELLELVATKAAKMRALREKMFAQAGMKAPPQPAHSADARKTEIARAALDVTQNLRQRSLFVDERKARE